MCGRARCSLSREEIRAAAKVSAWQNEDDYKASYNVAPGKTLPVLKQGPLSELATMKWGLVPSYTKAEDKPDFFRMFNARSETVATKSVFKKLLKSQRCIIFTNGFYEWKQEGLQKQPYFIHLKGQEVMRMAGLYDFWKGPEGLKMLSATILTTDSSERLTWLHDRMPVILPTDEAVQTWLEGDETAAIQPYNGEDLQWYAVDTKMSNMKEDGAECCRPLKRKAISTFFKPKSAEKGEGAVRSQGKVKQEGTEQTPEELHAPDGAMLAEKDINDTIKQEGTEVEVKAEALEARTEDIETQPDNQRSAPTESAHSPATVKRKQPVQSPGSKKKAKPSPGQKGTITAFFAKNSA